MSTNSLYASIIEALQRGGGKMLESNLVDALRNRGLSFTSKELRSALLKLEISGYLRVFSLDEERRIIELVGGRST